MAFHQLLCGAIEGHAEEQVGSLHGQAARQASSALMADVMVYLEELQIDGLHPLLGSVTCSSVGRDFESEGGERLAVRHAPLLGRVYGLRFTVCFYVLPISTRPVRARIVGRGNLF